MKIDLTKLERKAKAAPQKLLCVLGDHGRERSPAIYFGDDNTRASEDTFVASVFTADGDRGADVDVALARHLAANSPPVTLALIARIRELEGTVRSFARPELHGRSVAAALISVVEKGAVLP